MRQRWRELPAGVQDAVVGVAFAVVWFAAYRYWRADGWRPRYPDTYELAGLWSALALGLRRVAPWPLLLVTAIAYPLLYHPDAPDGVPLAADPHRRLRRDELEQPGAVPRRRCGRHGGAS